MIYVMQSAAPGERIVHIGRFHPLYTVAAVMNVALGVLFGIIVYVAAIYGQMQMGLPFSIRKWDLDDSWLSIIFKLHPAVHFIAGAFVLMGAYKCLYMLVARATTEIAITTERVVYKHGLVARYVGEMNIERIEGVNVYQSFLGRMLDFGQVVIHGMGVGQIVLPPIVNPIKFRRGIEYARTLKEDDDDKKRGR